MFDRLLIANRGEIACRIMRTAGRLGIRTIAVYSEADAGALHVASADEALPIGPAAAAESYLRGDRIIEAALSAGAQAVHPGYGFLAENAEFAEACREAGLVFVGPPPDAIRAMGSKSEAKALMEKAGVPLVPGYHGRAQTLKALREAAERIGYPLLIKPSPGGGGKGMRVVEAAGDLASALEASKRESKAAFGDDRVLLERYLARPRHVEMQIFADSHGACIHLYERDCSVQRRHQKVLEEAPAPGLPPETRRAMGEAAVAAARSIGYVGAGTVEFLYDSETADGPGFYFMEMNTRLQVEHPVTEMITGQDLVELAAARRPPESRTAACRQDAAPPLDGHAIEAPHLCGRSRLRDFLPATGRHHAISALPPESSRRCAWTAAMRPRRYRQSVHYDPMIAKLIVWDRDRDGRAGAACRQCPGRDPGGWRGLPMLDFLRGAGRPIRPTSAGEVETGFIDAAHAPSSASARGRRYRTNGSGAGTALAEILRRNGQVGTCTGRARQIGRSLFALARRLDGWRLNDAAP